MFKISLFCMCWCAVHICDAYKVLVISPFPAKSHSILGDGIVRHLLDDGQEVTYITAFPNARKQHPSLREIDVSSLHSVVSGGTGLKQEPRDLQRYSKKLKTWELKKVFIEFTYKYRRLLSTKTYIEKTIENMTNVEKIMKNEVDIRGLASLVSMVFEVQTKCLEHKAVQKLLTDPNEQFDVVIIEWMLLELVSGISAVFNCPYIWISTIDPHWMVLKLIDEVPNPTYTPDAQSSNVAPFTLVQRVTELLKIVIGVSLKHFYVAGREQKEYERLLAPIIRKRGHIVPDLEEVRYNASLMLGNSHVSMGQPTSLPQSYKAVGGYHIDTKVNPLPEELKKLLDNAKHGVIYFSLGSNLRSKDLPSEIKTNLLKIFGKLKQTVLWKFEDDLPNRPNNVHIVQWAPQQSILAHQNCILFITHGGLLSTTEAIHFGKPIIGIPIFADQFNNVDRFVKRGFARRVNLSYTMADDLEIAINDMLTDSRYVTNVKALSFVYHDRPVPPGKELAHWVKHVVLTGGAPHLRSPALMVPWYQKCYLDLAFLIIMILFVATLVLKKIIKRFSKKQKKKTQWHKFFT